MKLHTFSTLTWSLALGGLCAGGLVACGGVEGEVAPEATEAAVTGTQTNRSLVVTDAAILSRFSFTRTMDAVRRSAVSAPQALDGAETRLAVYQRWMRSFDVGTDGCDRASIDPNDYGLVCPRLPEAQLATINPFAATARVQFVPVGLFNRFDLMPSDGSTCGEHRIVYAMRLNAGAPFGGRAFIIFEAALPNPNPQLGVDGCLPVAEFWQQLTNDNDVTSRATKLENFYFNGTAIPGFGAVVQARNYGLRTDTGAALGGRAGQIRTNFFIDNRQWHLREFKLQTDCPTDTTCTLDFDHMTVKVNPAEELFAGTHPRSPAFLSAMPSQVSRLISTDVNTIGMNVNNNFNEFESVSQAGNVVYRSVASTSMRSAIQAELTRLSSTLTVDNVLDRATTQTCAGCHQVSNGQNLGGGLVWPGSRGFVHIDEQSRLSLALSTQFLPHRLRVLEDFITARELTGARAADETISGRPLDAPN